MMRIMKRVGLSMLLVLLAAANAFAQKAGAAAEEEAPKSYILAYVLVLLVTVLGVVAACRPSRRADRPKMVEKDLEEKIRQMGGKTE
jgi:ABC-type sugar transport system substrate-binding protein